MRPPGINAFVSLRAEEEPWLARAFYPPQDKALMAGPSSIIIYSEPGGGRSAVLSMLAYQALARAQRGPEWIVISWQPDPPERWGEDAVQEAWRHAILEKVAMGAMEFFARHPQRRQALPAWGRAYLDAFIIAFKPQKTFSFTLMQMLEDAPDVSHAWLQTLTNNDREWLIPPEIVQQFTIAQALQRLLNAMQRGDVRGVWLMIDGFERWQANLDLDQDKAKKALQRFFSTLTYFDQTGFFFKIATPLSWRRLLTRTHAVSTRRIAEFELHWSKEELKAIVERRLALASDGEIVKLSDLCQASEVEDWLQRYGGDNPRRWLAWTGDLYRAYLAQDEKRPLSAEAWKRIRSRLSPRLQITADKRVWVGSMEVKGISESLFRVLEYLYVRDGEICSRKELYTRAYRPDEGLIGDWDGVMETVLWRLRQAIEPDPRHPIFLITERKRGIRLARTR